MNFRMSLLQCNDDAPNQNTMLDSFEYSWHFIESIFILKVVCRCCKVLAWWTFWLKSSATYQKEDDW